MGPEEAIPYKVIITCNGLEMKAWMSKLLHVIQCGWMFSVWAMVVTTETLEAGANSWRAFYSKPRNLDFILKPSG